MYLLTNYSIRNENEGKSLDHNLTKQELANSDGLRVATNIVQTVQLQIVRSPASHQLQKRRSNYSPVNGLFDDINSKLLKVAGDTKKCDKNGDDKEHLQDDVDTLAQRFVQW